MKLTSAKKPETSTPRIKATYRGEVLGWFDTAAEGQQAIDAARAREQAEEAWKPWYLQ